MSKMGSELDKRLDENKYEMYELLKRTLANIKPLCQAVFPAPLKLMDDATKLLAKIEGIDE